MLFPDQKSKEECEKSEHASPMQESIERGLFGEAGEESKAIAQEDGGMEVDEVSSGSGSGSTGAPQQSSRPPQERTPDKDGQSVRPEVLQRIAAGVDCFIGDDELLGNKKALLLN